MSKKTQAKSTASMLTVGFHSADPPLIWRFDLERNHSFTLALQGDDGGWELGVTSPKGDFYPVAHFAAREDADEAFVKVEKALLGKKRTISATGKIMLTLAAVVIVILVGILLSGIYANMKLAGTTVAPTQSGAIQPDEAPPPPPQPAVVQQPVGTPEGIPLPADEVLKAPRH